MFKIDHRTDELRLIIAVDRALWHKRRFRRSGSCCIRMSHGTSVKEYVRDRRGFRKHNRRHLLEEPEMSENIEPQNQSGNASGDSTPAKKRNVKKIILWVVVGIVAFVVVITFTVNSATKAPVKVSNQFLDYIQAGDAAGAYALFSSEAQQVVPTDQFDTLVAQVAPILNTKESMNSKSINGETGQAATSTVTYEIDGTDGKTYLITVNLIKEDGDWKVLNFESDSK